jgi:hypothetical protein
MAKGSHGLAKVSVGLDMPDLRAATPKMALWLSSTLLVGWFAQYLLSQDCQGGAGTCDLFAAIFSDPHYIAAVLGQLLRDVAPHFNEFRGSWAVWSPLRNAIANFRGCNFSSCCVAISANGTICGSAEINFPFLLLFCLGVTERHVEMTHVFRPLTEQLVEMTHVSRPLTEQQEEMIHVFSALPQIVPLGGDGTI